MKMFCLGATYVVALVVYTDRFAWQYYTKIKALAFNKNIQSHNIIGKIDCSKRAFDR
jgi:hypothetical protein